MKGLQKSRRTAPPTFFGSNTAVKRQRQNEYLSDFDSPYSCLELQPAMPYSRTACSAASAHGPEFSANPR